MLSTQISLKVDSEATHASPSVSWLCGGMLLERPDRFPSDPHTEYRLWAAESKAGAMLSHSESDSRFLVDYQSDFYRVNYQSTWRDGCTLILNEVASHKNNAF